MLKTSYSNSAHDEQPGEAGLREDEATVRRMYEMAPYPDLGAALKTIDFFSTRLEKTCCRDKPSIFSMLDVVLAM